MFLQDSRIYLPWIENDPKKTDGPVTGMDAENDKKAGIFTVR